MGRRESGLLAQAGPDHTSLRAKPIREQTFTSNSLASFSDRLVMKLYRIVDDGPNPDLELGRYLGQHDFAGVPPLLGSLEVTRGSRSRATLAMVQGYVHHEGNLWEATREAVVAFLHDVEAETEAPDVDAGGRGFLLRLSQREAPATAVRLMGPSLVIAETLAAASVRCTASWPRPTRMTPAWRPRRSRRSTSDRSTNRSGGGSTWLARRSRSDGRHPSHGRQRQPRLPSRCCLTSMRCWAHCATCAATASASVSMETCTWVTCSTPATTWSSLTSRVTSVNR